MDRWGIDALVTGSQKALMLPPGLAFLALSPRAWKRADQPHLPGFYFDLKRERKSQAENTTAYTPAVSLVFGAVLIYCFWLVVATVAFWVVNMWHAVELFDGVFQTGRWPVGIYPGWLR